MKSIVWKSIKITLVFCVFFSLCYIFVLWAFAKVAGPGNGNAEVVTLDGKVVGAANVGQKFTKDIYFWHLVADAASSWRNTLLLCLSHVVITTATYDQSSCHHCYNE